MLTLEGTWASGGKEEMDHTYLPDVRNSIHFQGKINAVDENKSL